MRLKNYLNEVFRKNLKQNKSVEDMKKKGFTIVMWDVDLVGMVDKKGNPAEVYPDGKVKYPKKRI